MVNSPPSLSLRKGIAYAVFKCSDQRPFKALAARFKEALENIKLAHEETRIPPETEFSVFALGEGMAYALFADGATGVGERIHALQKQGANFLIRSSLPNAPNETAARDLGDAMNMLYGGTELFDAENEGRAKLVMDVFYRNDRSEFVSRLSVGLAADGRDK